MSEVERVVVHPSDGPPPMEVNEADLLVAVEELGVIHKSIEDCAFDKARGKPATERPPPMERSVSIVDLFANGRKDLEASISKSVRKRIQFDESVEFDIVQNIALIICKRQWLADSKTRRIAIFHFLWAFEPDTYVGNAHLERINDDELTDLFLAVLRLDAKRPTIAQSLMRKRSEAPVALDLELLDAEVRQQQK